MAHTAKPKRFRLSFVGPIEDQPRLIRAYGRACDGEFALVMRPSEGRAVLVLITKSDGAFVWRSGAETEDDGLVHAKATVLRDGRTKLRIETGDHAGVSFLPYEDLSASVGHGDLVDVTFSPDDQFANVSGPGSGGDAPLRPETPITAREAVALIKAEQKSVPKSGPTTLRGRWTGTLSCDDGQPRVELRRKLATYGTLTVSSHMGSGWSWAFERSDKWFSDDGVSSGEGFATLSAAIEGGVLGAMSLVREACSFRDTRRRAAHDPAYAAKHPIKTPKPMRNPTERLGTRRRGRTARVAAPPKPVEDGTPTPDVPQTPAALGRMAEEVSREGDALAELTGRRWIWEETTPPRAIAEWFDDNGFQGLAEAITDYAATTTYPVGEFILALKKDLRVCETVHDDDPDPKVYAEAQRQIELLHTSLTSTPAMMERARKLIRYASSMAQSPLCKGRDQRQAVEAARRAAEAYEEARAAILESHSWDALKTLRRIGERVALSAAKAARSCAAGQTSLTAVAEDQPPRERKSRRKPDAPPTPSIVPDGWEPFEEGDRVMFKDRHGAVTRVQARPYGPADKVTFLADGRKRGRRLEARLLVREMAPAVVGEAAVDAEKDKALIDAFSAAIAAAMGGEAA